MAGAQTGADVYNFTGELTKIRSLKVLVVGVLYSNLVAVVIGDLVVNALPLPKSKLGPLTVLLCDLFNSRNTF